MRRPPLSKHSDSTLRVTNDASAESVNKFLTHVIVNVINTVPAFVHGVSILCCITFNGTALWCSSSGTKEKKTRSFH